MCNSGKNELSGTFIAVFILRSYVSRGLGEGHLFMGNTEVICYTLGIGLMAIGTGAWRVRAARRQRWTENQYWRELFVRLERERSGPLG